MFDDILPRQTLETSVCGGVAYASAKIDFVFLSALFIHFSVSIRL